MGRKKKKYIEMFGSFTEPFNYDRRLLYITHITIFYATYYNLILSI